MPDLIANPSPRSASVGTLVRAWRTKRRLSQLALALDAGISTRHLSFVETGRSRPSADLLLGLADHLDVPLRERNTWLHAAGHAPRFPETSLAAPDVAMVRTALQRLLDLHDPYPGVALDRSWNVVLGNQAAARMMTSVPSFLLSPVPNMFRLSLHPQGFAAHTFNFDEWGRYLIGELRRMAESSTDPAISALLDEVSSYPNVRALGTRQPVPSAAASPLVHCILERGGTRLSLFSTLAIIGAPRDVMLAELTVELFYPGDEATAVVLRGAAVG